MITGCNVLRVLVPYSTLNLLIPFLVVLMAEVSFAMMDCLKALSWRSLIRNRIGFFKRFITVLEGFEIPYLDVVVN